MKLYHFTDPANVLLIAVDGLKPGENPDDDAIMTGGRPVVWLTTSTDNKPTAEDRAVLSSQGEATDEDTTFGGGSARLTVNVGSNSSRLKRYVDLPAAKQFKLPPSAYLWYVYFGTIPPERIDLAIPVPLALECLDRHITTHPDADARERFKEMRERVLDGPSDVNVEFTFPAGTSET